MGLGIKQFYEGKTIFLTGTTGFVGKVVLEKIIRSLGGFKKLFVMVRAKKNMTPGERFEKGILASEIFAPLFKENPNLRETLREKIIPVVGDLIINGLGLSPEDRAMVTAETEIVINVAASVNFDDPLLDAL
jgi:fatty acyl-CoA reductase